MRRYITDTVTGGYPYVGAAVVGRKVVFGPSGQDDVGILDTDTVGRCRLPQSNHR